MKLPTLLEKLQSSKEYQNLLKENPDAFISAGFFVQDLESNNNTNQIDFYIPKTDKVMAFTLDSEISIKEMELMHNKKPETLSLPPKVDLPQLKDLIEKEMPVRSITGTISKIIAVLQSVDNKVQWNINCVLSGLNILRATLNDETSTFEKFEKTSIMNFVKKA